LVDADGVVGEVVEDLALAVGEGEFEGGGRIRGGAAFCRGVGREGRWREVEIVGEGVEVLEDVFEAGGEDGTFAEEFVWAGGKGVIDAAGDGEDGAVVVFDGHAGGDESAGAFVGFDDEDASGEAADDAVSAGEIFGDGRSAEGVFADDDSSAGGDLVEKGCVFGGVGDVESGAEDGDGAAKGLGEGAAMSEGVDAASAAGDDGEAGTSQKRAETLRLLAAVYAALARAYHGQSI
jgi:hypothetical protein